MNEHEYTLQKGDLFISLPYSILGNITLSDNNSIKVFGLSSDFIKSIAKREKRIDAVIASVHGNPVYNIYENQEKQSVINTYSQLAIEKVNDSNTYMKKDILRYMFSAIFCEVMAEIGSNSNSIEFKSADTGNAMRVFKLFLKELSKDDGRHRSVSYYADLVCYSPKYLSHVVKSVSGRTAMSFINEHTIKQIKYQLLYSDKSIKEIAEEFNFPNLSFFGKYVKRNVGVSPIQFRTQSSNTKQ
jgi:AraC-like DNA-binding protein